MSSRSDAHFEEWMESLKVMKDPRPDERLPESLVTRPDSARWFGPEVTGNPSRLGILLDVPARTMEFILQEIPEGASSDLQRHPHESVHCVTEGSGYSEIGVQTVEWEAGDLIYTPPNAWHRHYNSGTGTVRMLLVENSRLLEGMGLNRRESAGNISYDEFRGQGD
jgi:quercetin dioxygenase-like cupin family protein